MHSPIEHHNDAAPSNYKLARICKAIADKLVSKATRERNFRQILNVFNIACGIGAVLLISQQIPFWISYVSALVLLIQLGYYHVREDYAPSRFLDHERYIRYYGDQLLELITNIDPSSQKDSERLSSLRTLAILNLQDVASKWPWCQLSKEYEPWLNWNLLAFNEVMIEESLSSVEEVWILTHDLEPDISDPRTFNQVVKNIKNGKRYRYFLLGDESRMMVLWGEFQKKVASSLKSSDSGMCTPIVLDWPQLVGMFEGHMNFSVYWHENGLRVAFQEVLSYKAEGLSGGWRKLSDSDCEELIAGVHARSCYRFGAGS